MNIESVGQDFQQASTPNRLRFGGALIAVGALTVASISSCNDEVLSPDQSLTPDASHTLTLDEMGADVGDNFTAIPKIFPCGLECITPEDLRKLNKKGLTVDPETNEIVNLIPKIFSCKVECIGPSIEDASSFDINPDH